MVRHSLVAVGGAVGELHKDRGAGVVHRLVRRKEPGSVVVLRRVRESEKERRRNRAVGIEVVVVRRNLEEGRCMESAIEEGIVGVEEEERRSLAVGVGYCSYAEAGCSRRHLRSNRCSTFWVMESRFSM